MSASVNFKRLKPWWVFTIAYICFMFIPRLVTQGLFGDGLLYASMARNLSIGVGEYWSPYFSSSYWLPYVDGTRYIENPPGMLWIQSMFFQIVGDHWWTEKLYSFFITAISCLLIVKVWNRIYEQDSVAKYFAFLPLLFWYTMPTIFWGAPNNLMDNSIVIPCLASCYFLIKAMQVERYITPSILATIFLFIAFMIKGPVGLYPIAIPFLYFLIYKKKQLTIGILHSILMTAAFGICLYSLLFFEPAAAYFQDYWDNRLGAVLGGGREDASLQGFAKLKIIKLVATELIVPILVAVIFIAVLKWKKQNLYWTQNQKRRTLFIFLLALAASLPIMLSSAQNKIYIIPGMSIYALAIASLIYPLLKNWYNTSTGNSIFNRRANTFFIAVLIGVLLFSWTEFGKFGREKDLLADLEKIKNTIPIGSKVYADEEMINNFNAQNYLQRFHRIELIPQNQQKIFNFHLSKSDTPINGYQRTDLETSIFKVFQKTRNQSHDLYSL